MVAVEGLTSVDLCLFNGLPFSAEHFFCRRLRTHYRTEETTFPSFHHVPRFRLAAIGAPNVTPAQSRRPLTRARGNAELRAISCCWIFSMESIPRGGFYTIVGMVVGTHTHEVGSICQAPDRRFLVEMDSGSCAGAWMVSSR